MAMNPASEATIRRRSARIAFARTSNRCRRVWIATVAIYFAVFAAVAAFSTVQAGAGETANVGPVAAVRDTIAEATPVFKNASLTPQARQQQLRAIAIKHFDFVYMARSAMGTHWKSLTAAQRREFVPTFTDYVMETYLGTLKQNTVESAGHGLKDKARIDSPGFATVFGDVRMPNLADPLNVEYSMCRDGGTWKLYDIVVDGSSTMATYRREFNQKMNDGGFDKLEAELKHKVALASS